ncbi:MAG TPA: trypsin-like peptidase domain-containing protein [Blastocatellia bacterium]|nr:trypsin-like peptidase domain-containing protein [Blastocatellia bacterium]
MSDAKNSTSLFQRALTVVWLILISSLAVAGQEHLEVRRHSKLKTFEKFLDKNPAISADLAKDPSLIKDTDYLAKHPDLEKFVKDHPGLTDEVLSKVQECKYSIPSIFDRASPSVVYIYATSINPYRTEKRVEHVIGSGFIIDQSGIILTNSHVAFPRQSILVGLENGTALPAQLVGADPIFDVAVLKIDKPANVQLSALTLGDSDLVHVGTDAIAIGNPLGLDQTLTKGAVSATNRVLPATFFSQQEPLIQIDTPINPGNSGGPLLNRCGDVIGITTAIIPDAQNIGFAIPINLVKAVLPTLTSQGRVVRPWLGFHGQYIDNNLQSFLRVPLATGFLVEVVEPGSPAAKAQIQGGDLEFSIGGHDFLLGGDIVTKMNGVELDTVDKAVEALEGIKVGANVTLTVFRAGKTAELSYTVPERPLLPGDIAGQNAALPTASARVGSTAGSDGFHKWDSLSGLDTFRY